MSDSVVKLRIDSKEYDANIKRAGDALTDYFRKVKEGGGTLMHLDEGVMEAVQAMGELGTMAKNAKGGLRELTQATTDMTIAYRSLTDEEKASPLGKAMQDSIAQMTERASEMKDAMADVNAAITNAASDTRTFDQIAGAANLATSSFQVLQGATKVLGIEIGDNVEVIAKLQAAMAVTNGLTQIQNSLQKQSALMQGVMAIKAAAAAAAQSALASATGAATVAQRAFNAVANANPYILLASAIAATVSALYLFSSGDNDAEKAQSALNDELERTRRQLAAIDRESDFSIAIAEAAGKSWNEIHELRLEAARTKLALADMGYDALVASGKATKEQLKQAAEESRKAWEGVLKVLDEGVIHDVQARNKNGKKTNTSNGISKPEKKEIEDTKGSVAELTKEIRELQKVQQQSTSPMQWKTYQDKIEDVTKKVKELKGELANLEIGSLPEAKGVGIASQYLKDAEKRGTMPTRDSIIAKGESQIRGYKGYQENKSEVKLNSTLNGIASGMSQMVSGMEQLGIELPESVHKAISAIQGISSILTGIATTVLAIEAITTADTITPFARGGIVGKAASGLLVGNHMSGDNLRMPVIGGGMIGLNDGELILNKAQQGVIANDLRGNPFGNLNFTLRASGENLIAVIEHTGKRKGKGELVWWKS